MICIFGGTAAYHLTSSDFGEHQTLPPLDTPFGPAPVFLRLRLPSPVGAFPTGVGVLFSSRHGPDRLARSAAFVNHCANLWAAKEYGATAILSWNGVGAINPTLRVGDMLVPDDLIDATRARTLPSPVEHPERNCEAAKSKDAMREGPGVGVRGIFSEPHRTALLTVINTPSPVGTLPTGEGPGVGGEGGVYVCTEGPRLETPAEINAFALMGADVVGMTLVPEVFIAAEMNLPYASLCLVTNIAAGRAQPDSPRRFGVEVAREGLAVCLKAARQL
jgi:5'-methylthioadenosine phosphorylase